MEKEKPEGETKNFEEIKALAKGCGIYHGRYKGRKNDLIDCTKKGKERIKTHTALEARHTHEKI